MSQPTQDATARIVVGVDGSEQSKMALKWAAHLAAASGARIDAVLAWEYPVSFGWAQGWTYTPDTWNPREDAEKSLVATVDEVFGSDRPADMKLLVQEGNAARILLDQSKGATMLVVGSRGHGGFAGLLLGSVSQRVVTHARCPVVVVHAPAVATKPAEA